MKNYNPLLLVDFYKVCHSSQYPKGLTKMVSYYTPRMSRLKDVDTITFFGLQGFIKEYLIDGFDTMFFSRPEDEVVAEYERILDYTLGKGAYESQKIRDLHRLGYLPLEISAVPEGMATKVGVPQIEITNTHPDFIWLVNTIETMLSCTMWHTQVSAEVGKRYRKIVDKWVDLTCGVDVNPRKMLGDFSMRGQHSVESAIKSSAAWTLSFDNTATVPAIMWLEDNYNCDVTKDSVAYGAISTEHSVMCSNFAVDGDEITHIKRLLIDIYFNHNFSMVSDSYDYWRLVTELLPQCKDEILAHNGTLFIRGDSGNPVEILAGKDIFYIHDNDAYGYDLFADGRDTNDWFEEYCRDNEIDTDTTLYVHYKDKYYAVEVTCDWSNERGAWTDRKYYYVEDYNFKYTELEPNGELLGTVWALDQIVGHTVNSKGYKVLNPKLKAIYGDSIIPDYADEVYRRLWEQGYAANNVVMGVGSMSMMALVGQDEDTGKLVFAGEHNGTNCGPYTRDTFGIAVKATYAEDENGKPINIFKQPKAISWKKSQKGCCIVAPDGMSYTDEHTWDEVVTRPDNLLEQVFYNGRLAWETDLKQVRRNMYPQETFKI